MTYSGIDSGICKQMVIIDDFQNWVDLNRIEKPKNGQQKRERNSCVHLLTFVNFARYDVLV